MKLGLVISVLLTAGPALDIGSCIWPLLWFEHKMFPMGSCDKHLVARWCTVLGGSENLRRWDLTGGVVPLGCRHFVPGPSAPPPLLP